MIKKLGIILITAALVLLAGCASKEDAETVETAESTETVSEEESLNEAGGEPEETEEEPGYTFTSCSTKMYTTSNLNVRDLPAITGNKLGCLLFEQEITVTGQCNETGWYRIKYKDREAYVCNDYVAKELPGMEPEPLEKTDDGETDKKVEKLIPEPKPERVFIKNDPKGFPVYDFMDADDIAEVTDYPLGKGVHEKDDLFSFYERRLPNALPDFESGCMDCYHLAKELGYTKVEAIDFETVEMYGIEDDRNIRLICVEKVTMQGCK